MEEWRVVQAFPSYSVSSRGLVRSDIKYKNGNTGRIIRQCTNQKGIVYVGLMRNGIQYKRSVALLVAHAFIMTARPLSFNTPINLDGDRSNNRVENLLWRPTWFAREYFQQFSRRRPARPIRPARIATPIMDIKTREVYKNSWVAAITFGLLDREIHEAIENRTYVWPTYQRFEVL